MEVKEEQLDFSDWEHSRVKKQTRKEKFLWQVEAGYPSQTAGEAAGAFLSPNGTPRRKAALAAGDHGADSLDAELVLPERCNHGRCSD